MGKTRSRSEAKHRFVRVLRQHKDVLAGTNHQGWFGTAEANFSLNIGGAMLNRIDFIAF
ncbi:MAG: hypothetical protein QGG02_01490 [Gammaproteobacteria bacterium]|jgi:hypothetical protein|nr:hypothetical protein [Gammaproteobacteria bacterium]MDP6732559.1 hypothetical protein [Gammaproteobacteria bacterium]|tara:strand:- start:366 stop:542 length:177 start_codon:yes stop_codon:yes gene_type:complete